MEQNKVYSEVYAVLSALNNEYIRKTPRKILDKIEKSRDPSYTPNIDETKPLDEQGLSKEAIAMLAALKLDYWCESEEEKEALRKILIANDQKDLQK